MPSGRKKGVNGTVPAREVLAKPIAMPTLTQRAKPFQVATARDGPTTMKQVRYAD
jgi:hypothetical protein